MSEPTLAEATPVIPQALLGYRAWDVIFEDGEPVLISTGDGRSIWKAGVNRAWCGKGREHPAPHPGCDCGLYARHQLRSVDSTAKVIGAVAARGEVHLHASGFRAEEMVILGLLIRKPDQWSLAHRQALSRRYEVPVYESAQELQEAAAELATPAPKQMIPRSDPRQSDEPFPTYSEIFGRERFPVLLLLFFVLAPLLVGAVIGSLMNVFIAS